MHKGGRKVCLAVEEGGKWAKHSGGKVSTGQNLSFFFLLPTGVPLETHGD